MANAVNIFKASMPKICSNYGFGRLNNKCHLSYMLSLHGSNNTCSTSFLKWNIHRFPYSTKPQENISVATQIANDVLASKKKEVEKSSPKDEFEKDQISAEEDKERTRRATKFSFIAFGVMMAGVGTTLIFRWGAPYDDNGEPINDELSHLPVVEQYLRRTYREMRVMNKMIQEPSRDKLLPDELSGQYIQPPYTLVLELKDVLVNPQWTYENGWRFKRRPGIDYLLQHCAPPLFEIVIYTKEQGMTVDAVIDKIDPNGYIWYRLFKDSTLYLDGKHMKELNSLNRDLKKVIMVDWDSEATSCSRNQLRVPRWNGNSDDQGLWQLAMLLRTIAESDVDDVRDVLDYYRQYDDPLGTFTQLKKQAEDLELQLKKEAEENKAAHWSPSLFKKWK